MFIKLILSKQLTINKCTLLDCINTEILMYCIYLQYTHSVWYYLHTLLSFGTDTQTGHFRPLVKIKYLFMKPGS